jgi:bifunctional non-homologous end joining protein LigD
VRPKPGAPVSTPLRWEELTPTLDPGRFTMEAVLRRVEKEGDLFEPVLRGGQALGAALRRLERHSATQAAARSPSQSGVSST